MTKGGQMARTARGNCVVDGGDQRVGHCITHNLDRNEGLCVEI